MLGRLPPPCDPPRSIFGQKKQRRVVCDLALCNLLVIGGFVAQIILRRDYPLPQTDLAYGHGTGYAKSCEAVQDRGTDLDLRNLPIEVARREALTE